MPYIDKVTDLTAPISEQPSRFGTMLVIINSIDIFLILMYQWVFSFENIDLSDITTKDFSEKIFLTLGKPQKRYFFSSPTTKDIKQPPPPLLELIGHIFI